MERAPGTFWIGGWMGPTAGLDDVEKRKFLTLQGLELQPVGRPARSQLSYRLRYPGSLPEDSTRQKIFYRMKRLSAQTRGTYRDL
jgi:hypothetical protein